MHAQPHLKLSVVFSFRNEEKVLPELIRRVRAVMDLEMKECRISTYELVFVNDASTDRSFEVLIREAAVRPDVRVVTLSRRFGIQPSIIAGLRYASGDQVVFLDSDLQDPPEVICEVLKKQRESKADVIHTVRLSRQGESRGKLFITRIGYLILNKFTHVRIPIEAGDFKLLTRRALNVLLSMDERKPFVRGMTCWVGFKQAFVPYHRAPRFMGKSSYPIISWDVFNNFFESALISFSAVPLRMTFYASLLSILFSLALIVHVAIEKINGRALPGWSSLMVAIAVIGSFQLFCTGIMGLYIGTIYEEVKKRPAYIVESLFGFPDDDPGRKA